MGMDTGTDMVTVAMVLVPPVLSRVHIVSVITVSVNMDIYIARDMVMEVDMVSATLHVNMININDVF